MRAQLRLLPAPEAEPFDYTVLRAMTQARGGDGARRGSACQPCAEKSLRRIQWRQKAIKDQPEGLSFPDSNTQLLP